MVTKVIRRLLAKLLLRSQAATGFSVTWCGLSAAAEEVGHEGGTLVGEDAFGYCGFGVEGILAEGVVAAFVVACSVHNPAYLTPA